MNAHLQRWLTALVAVPALFALLFWGNDVVVALLVLLLAVGGMREYGALVFSSWERREAWQGLALAVLFPIVFYLGSAPEVLALLVLAVLGIFLARLIRVGPEGPDARPAMKAVFGIIYVPVLLSHLIWLRQGTDGREWVFFVIITAFAGDVAAYYTGRALGKRKLLPTVSGGKTEEGVWGLLVGGAGAAALYATVFLPDVGILSATVLGLFASVLGQLGDLCESMLKRASGAKDSGTMLPGHGGILDRLDCLLFMIPFVYYVKEFCLS